MNSSIETLNQLGGQLLQFAWPMLWQSSLLIAFVFALDFLLGRRIRASVRYALWLAVLAKLILPPTLALPTSPVWWLHKTPPAVQAKPQFQNFTVTYDSQPLPEIPQNLPAFIPPKPRLSLVAWSLAASVFVSLMLCGWLLARWWQIARIVRRAATAENFSPALNEAWRLSGAPGTRPARFKNENQRAEPVLGAPKVGLKIVEGRMSPAVCGLFRPVILLPRVLAENLSATQLRAVLLHEMFHLRRKDVWVNCAQALLQIVYWWHPLLWFANARIRRLREEAVDDAVMLALRDEADGYAPTLLEVAKLAFRRPLLSLGLVGIMESRSALRQRIERLVDFRAPRRAGLTLVSLLGILAFTAVAVPMGARPQTDNNTNAVVLEKDASASTKQSFTSNQTLIVTEAMFSNAWKKFTFKTISPTDTEQPTLAEAFGTLLSASLEHKSDLIRSYEVDALLRSNSPNQKVVMALHRFIEAKSNSLPVLIGALNYSDSNFWAADILGMMGSVARPAVPALQNALQSRDEYMRWRAAVALNKIDSNFPPPPVLATNFQDTANVKIDAEPIEAKARAAHLVQDGKLLYEMGKLDEAESKLKTALALAPENGAAKYYLGLVQAARQHPTNNQIKTGRQNIVDKLEQIRLGPFGPFMGVSLGEVVRQLNEMARRNDRGKTGVDIVILTNSLSSQSAGIDSMAINLPGPLMNVTLGGALEAIVQNASRPLKYSILDDMIVLSMQDGSDIPTLYSRHFRVETTDFMAAMRKVPGIKTNIVSAMAKDYFKTLGVDLDVPGKSVFYGDRLGELFVRATKQDLDTIESALEVFSRVAPQIHIKARFVEAPKGTLDGLKNIIAVTNQAVKSNQAAGLVGILTDENFKTVLRNLEARPGVETLAEPEVITTSGRQTQMRATDVVTIITNSVFEEYPTNQNGSVGSVTVKTSPIETGPILDAVPWVLSDGQTIYLSVTASRPEFWGYAEVPTNAALQSVTNSAGEVIQLPNIWPAVEISQKSAQVNMFDGQTLVLTGFQPEPIRFAAPDAKREETVANWIRAGKKKNHADGKELIVFVTATIVDPAGNRVHADDELPSAKTGIPPQPGTAK